MRRTAPASPRSARSRCAAARSWACSAPWSTRVRAIPPFITVLTGITQAMVLPAPPIEVVLPSLLEFLRGAVLVAHNAPYDVGFLKAACARHGYPWPALRVLDTAALARRVLTRDEVPNRKLGTLAAYFRADRPAHPPGPGRRPGHGRRAARADRPARRAPGAHPGRHDRVREGGHPDPAAQAAPRRRAAARARASTSSGPPTTGRSTSAPRWTSPPGCAATSPPARSGPGSREMLAAAVRVEAVECAHALEAEVRELRLIAAHAPPYNRRSKFPERVVWLKLTAEAYPRLSVVRALADDGAAYLGPFSSRRTAELAAAGVYDAVPLRQCTHKLSTRTTTPACALAELGRCPAPVRAPDHPRGVRGPRRRAVPHRDPRRPAAGGGRPAGPDRGARRRRSATRRRRWSGPG